MDLEAFELVLLRRPQDAPPYPEEVLQRIQEEHLAYHARLREAGDIVTNGPVSDQPDGSLRGLTFYRTGSLAHARQLAEADPAVLAGRLAVEIMTWYCPPGTMSQPGRTVSLPLPGAPARACRCRSYCGRELAGGRVVNADPLPGASIDPVVSGQKSASQQGQISGDHGA